MSPTCVVVVILVVFSTVTGKEYGESCSSDSECSFQYAKCLHSVCTCDISDAFVGNKCILAIGARCHNRTCEAENSICISTFCVCKERYVQALNNSFCYKEPDTYGDYCEQDHYCLFLGKENGKCIGNECKCSDRFALHENKCKLKAETIGGECIPETQVCYLERDGDNQKIECAQNVCKCKEGYAPSKDFMSCNGAYLTTVSSFLSILTLILCKIII